MQEKLTIIDSRRVGKQNTLPTKNAVNDLYDATIRSLSLDIWSVESCLFLVFGVLVAFSPVHTCFSLPVSCLWQISVNNTFLLFPYCSLSSKILLVSFENCIFWTDTSS